MTEYQRWRCHDCGARVGTKHVCGPTHEQLAEIVARLERNILDILDGLERPDSLMHKYALNEAYALKKPIGDMVNELKDKVFIEMEEISDHYKLIIFDKDGTLCGSTHERGFANTPDEQFMLPDIVERCKELSEKGVQLGIASNQGGLAFGHVEVIHASQMVRTAADAIGANLDFCTYCGMHPEGTLIGFRRDSFMRKPKPGMLLRIMLRAEILPKEVLFVGDRPEDEQAAQAAGCDFMWAWEFFDRERPEEKTNA